MGRPASVALALAVVLAACGGDGDGTKGSDSEQVIAAVTGYAHAFGAGDGERACALLTPSAREALIQRVESLVRTADCPAAVEKLASLAGPNVAGPFREAKANEAEVDGDNATATLVAAGHATEVGLEKRDGDWLLTRAPGL